MEWSATSALRGSRQGYGTLLELDPYVSYSGPWVTNALAWGSTELSHALGLGSALDGLLPPDNEYGEARFWPGTTHGRLFVAATTDSTYTPMDSPYRIDFVTQKADQPMITFTVSQPYAYLYLPLEDYLIVVGLIAWFLWAVVRSTRRAARRRHVEFEDDEGGVADVA